MSDGGGWWWGRRDSNVPVGMVGRSGEQKKLKTHTKKEWKKLPTSSGVKRILTRKIKILAQRHMHENAEARWG